MDPFTSRKPPTGPSSTSAYRLNRPNMRQHNAPMPVNEARAAALKTPTPSFDPSKPSFKPVQSLKSYEFLDDIVAERKKDVTPEQIRIQALEDSMTMYNGSHALKQEQLAYQADKIKAQADKIQEQADLIQAQADQIKAEGDQTKYHAEETASKVSGLQNVTGKMQEQAEQTDSGFTALKTVLRGDFRTIRSQIQSGSTEVRELTARLEAADRERNWMANHMRLNTLAEAETHELMARRLRESVLGPDGVGQVQGNASRLQLTAEPLQQQEDVAVGSPMHAQRPVEVASPTVRGDEAVAPEAKAADSEVANHTVCADWQPYAVSQLSPLSVTATNDVTFTWEELHRYFGGAQYSPGLYLASNDFEGSILKGKTFWLLEAQFEPFAPKAPGQHGAKLTPFFNDTPTENGCILDEEDYSNVPVFICLAEGQNYTYLGTYSQRRYSDKLSHSELFQHVPEVVLKYWAELLADPDRPAWVTEQLITNFWPAPTYTGPIPTDVAVATPATGVSDPRDAEKPIEKRVVRALEEFALELRDWKKESQLKAQLLTEDALMEMWSKSDLDKEKGLRPWLEYLECAGFDSEFYEKLVTAKQAKGKKVVAIKAEPSMAGSATPRASGGNTGEQRRDSAADVPDLKLDESPIKEAKFKCTRRPAARR